MTAPCVTIDGNRYPTPTSSSALWNDRDQIDGRLNDPDLFHALLEDTHSKDEHGRPIYKLSEKVAFNDAALRFHAKSKNENGYICAAYLEYIAKHPEKFIAVSDLEKTDNLSLLHGQWIIFQKSKLGFIQERLCAGEGDLLLKFHGKPVSSMGGLDNLHRKYFLTVPGDMIRDGQFPVSSEFSIAGDEVMLDPRMHIATGQSANATQTLLYPIAAKTFGLDGEGLILLDDENKAHHVPGNIFPEKGRVNIANFGVFTPSRQTQVLTFLRTDGRHSLFTTISPNDARWHSYNFSPHVKFITRHLLESGAWQLGTRARVNRVMSWMYHKATPR